MQRKRHMLTKYTCKHATIIFVNSAEKRWEDFVGGAGGGLYVCVREGKEGGSHVEDQQMDTHG